MNATRFAVILFCLILVPLSVQGADEITQQKLKSEGKTRTYYLYVPPGVEQATSVPLLIVLHGSGRDGRSLVEPWKPLAKAEGFIVVGPDSSDSSSWRIPQDAPEFLHDLTEELIKKYPIAQNRIYLFGHSAGAVVALSLAMFESEYYAAVAIHAGAWRSDKELKVIESATRKIPLMLIVGDRDTFFSVNEVRQTQTVLVDRGFNVNLVIIKHHTHSYYSLANDVNDFAWKFLKENSLAGERRHVRMSFGSKGRESNARTKDLNKIKRRANELIDSFYVKEEELRKKNLFNDKSGVAEIARSQVQLLDEALNSMREMQAIAEAAHEKGGREQEYYSLLSQAAKLRVDSLELLRARSELLLSSEDMSSVIVRRNELGQKSHAANQAAEELEKRADKIR